MTNNTNEKPDLLGVKVALAISLIALAASLYWLYAGGALDEHSSTSTVQNSFGGVSTTYRTSYDPRFAIAAVAASFLFTAMSAWVLVKRIKKR